MADYTTIDDPSAHFQIASWTGNTTAPRNITNDGKSDLKPDLIWGKNRTSVQDNIIFDSTRGFDTDGSLVPNHDAVEGYATTYGYVGAHLTDGFTSTAGGTNDDMWNENGSNFVAWQWKANGGTTVSNSNGSITSTVQANTAAGFSIVSYTGTDVAGATVGHGLSQAPELWIIKRRDTADWWAIGTTHGIDETKYLALNTAAVAITHTTVWNDTAPTATVFSLGTADAVNATEAYIAYCFAGVQGYSKFGQLGSNGNVDGPYVVTGFRPAFVMVKNALGGVGRWAIFDNKRPGNYNAETSDVLYANYNSAEYTGTDYFGMDFYANGFKLTEIDSEFNDTGDTMIYAAFAENPFVTSGGVPATAR